MKQKSERFFPSGVERYQQVTHLSLSSMISIGMVIVVVPPGLTASDKGKAVSWNKLYPE